MNERQHYFDIGIVNGEDTLVEMKEPMVPPDFGAVHVEPEFAPKVIGSEVIAKTIFNFLLGDVKDIQKEGELRGNVEEPVESDIWLMYYSILEDADDGREFVEEQTERARKILSPTLEYTGFNLNSDAQTVRKILLQEMGTVKFDEDGLIIEEEQSNFLLDDDVLHAEPAENIEEPLFPSKRRGHLRLIKSDEK